MVSQPATPLKLRESSVQIVEECFRREAGASAALPDETVDLIQTGILDSMAWVSFLRSVETASGISDLGSTLNERPATLASVFAALQYLHGKPSEQDDQPPEVVRPGRGDLTVITGSS